MLVIEGTLETIIYRNEENSYTVARLSTEDGVITVVGYFGFRPVGSKLSLSGDIVYHKKYGEQFQVKRILDAEEDYKSGMEAYLKNGGIKNIGPVLAERIIEKFGDDTYDIFKNNPERLKEVEGIGEKTYEKIINSFNEQADVRDVFIKLSDYGISDALANKLFMKYGDGVLEIIKKNPYKLIDENSGIGFKTADSIAKMTGVKENDPNRIEAFIVFLLERAANDGNCYMPLETLKEDAKKFLSVTDEDVESAIKNFAKNKTVQINNSKDGIIASLASLNNAENIIAFKINDLIKKSKPQVPIDIESRIKTIESIENIKFDQKQIEAIKEAFNSKVLIITGGPGTGKTTTLNAILVIAEELGEKVALAAPTGRAAKRMEETTGREAKTIHRLLEYQFNGKNMEFGRNEDNNIDENLIVIDEMSMVDTFLMADLMKALKDDDRLILLGDINQIPSVGPGNVLKDLINSKIVKIVKLETVFRQAEESRIVTNAHRINMGQFPIANEKNTDFFMISSPNEKNTAEIIKSLIKERLPNFSNFKSFRDIQVLAPMKKGISGVQNLNIELQNSLNPKSSEKNEFVYRDTLFRTGDKVMQTKNDYQAEWKSYDEDGIEYDSGLGIYNGDIGFIKSINKFSQELTVDFDGREVVYDEESIDELSLAYAITIHKSQGSEFPAVIIPIHFTPPMLGTRNLIYTAVTRAKDMIVLVGEEQRLTKMIQNTYIDERYTGLGEKLVDFDRIIKYEDKK